jgi:hypothetical protein
MCLSRSVQKCLSSRAPPATQIVSRFAVEQILEFFFSIFPRRESQPVQGILQGALGPRPALTCRDGQRVGVEDVLKPGAYKVAVTVPNFVPTTKPYRVLPTVGTSALSTYSCGTYSNP